MSLSPAQQLGEIFERDCKESAFRAEFRRTYWVNTDENAQGVSDFDRWVAGAAAPDPVRKAAVLQAIRDERAAGIRTSRVKVMSAQPTLYEIYACEWGYDYNQILVDGVMTGEEIYIWDLAEHWLPRELEELPDFWLLDDQLVILMHYDELSRFVGIEQAPSRDLMTYLLARETLLRGSVAFNRWWDGHAELHRTRRAA